VIAADTSTWVAFFQGDAGDDTEWLDRALEERQVVMVPVVLTELLSDPGLPAEVSEMLLQIPPTEIRPGFWQRAGMLRAAVLATRRRVRLGDALIAQTCIDARVVLLTRDRDFREFVEAAKLDLLLARP
jgi:predicted nucleic acid-binding protein